MVNELGPSSASMAMPSAKYDPAGTTITSIGDDLLREIFHRLPSLPSIVRAALACRTFLHAVRSSPAFRRRFLALRPPQILGFFDKPVLTCMPPFIPLRSRSDKDLAAAVRGADFLLTRVPEDSGDQGWEIDSCLCGFVLLHNQNTSQMAAYNPLTQALHMFPYPSHETCRPSYLRFRIIFSEEDQGSFRVVCVRCRVRRNNSRQCSSVRVSVFSSESGSREWQVFSWVDTATRRPGHDGGDRCVLSHTGTATLVNEFDILAYWKHKNQAFIVVFDTATLRLSRMDLPPPLKDMDYTQVELGLTKDGKLSMVCIDDFDANKGKLAVWFWRDDGDGVHKWMPHKVFPLSSFIDATMCSAQHNVTMQVVVVIDGFVFLSVNYRCSECLLSFCLEKESVSKLIDHEFDCSIHLYIMAWPPSFVGNKEDSETKVARDDVTGDGSVDTEETPSVLVTALRSYREALINDDRVKVTEIEAFLLSVEDEKRTLVRKIATLDAELTNARESILRINAESDEYRRRVDKCARESCAG